MSCNWSSKDQQTNRPIRPTDQQTNSLSLFGDHASVEQVNENTRVMAKLLARLHPDEEAPKSGIHPTAVVSERARIHGSASIGPYAIVGACGVVRGGQVFQAKGFPYTLTDLFGPTQDTTPFVDGCYVTLRLTSAMYHRFHAPHDFALQHVTHIAGDTWNVNPIALARVERLFCRNERAVLRGRLVDGTPIALVPVAAILVASLRLHALDLLLHTGHRGPNELPCAARYAKGDELGWFEQGSTIIAFVPAGHALAAGVAPGMRVRMGQALLRRTAAAEPPSPA